MQPKTQLGSVIHAIAEALDVRVPWLREQMFRSSLAGVPCFTGSEREVVDTVLALYNLEPWTD